LVSLLVLLAATLAVYFLADSASFWSLGPFFFDADIPPMIQIPSWCMPMSSCFDFRRPFASGPPFLLGSFPFFFLSNRGAFFRRFLKSTLRTVFFLDRSPLLLPFWHSRCPSQASPSPMLGFGLSFSSQSVGFCPFSASFSFPV